MPFEPATSGHGDVVVGVDGSVASLRALSWATGLAARNGAGLVVVHVRHQASLPVPETAWIDADQVWAAGDDLEGALRAEIDDALKHIEGLTGRMVVRRGDPVREITAVAAEQRADAIVVGSTRRRGRWSRRSLSGRLVRHGRWPVIVVP
jgi:nucleotide-binding universal stress UspA family protein